MEAIHRIVRLLASHCSSRITDLLSSRWSVPQHWHFGPDQTIGQSSGGATWRVSFWHLGKLSIIDPFVICCGQTLMTDAVGESHPEVLDTHSDKTYQSNSTMPTTSSWSPEHINLSWTDTIGPMKETLLQCFQLLTTATDVETKQQSWKWMNSWNTHCKS